MTNYVIVNENGRFFTGIKRSGIDQFGYYNTIWVEKYSEAILWSSRRNAIALCQILFPLPVRVIKDYGLETEETIDWAGE